MFIGNAVAHRLAAPVMDELAALGAKLGAPFRRTQVETLAKEVATTGDPVKARALIQQDRLLLDDELRLYQRIAADPAELAAFGPSTRAALRGQAETQAGNLRALTVEHAVHSTLHEDAPGAAWSGVPERVELVLTEARATGAEITSRHHRSTRRDDGSLGHGHSGLRAWLLPRAAPLESKHWTLGPGDRRWIGDR